MYNPTEYAVKKITKTQAKSMLNAYYKRYPFIKNMLHALGQLYELTRLIKIIEAKLLK